MKKYLTLLFALTSLQLSAQTKAEKDVKPVDSTKTYKLNEVTIKSKTPITQVLTDKIKVNVSAMPGIDGLNALELLKQSPGITVDGQDNIRMGGKNGIQIMIDGKLQVLSLQQAASLLKATPAVNIKSIELISSPSAKYDASGNAGIINIILKKPSSDGYSASISAGYQFTEHFRQNSSFLINAKTKDLLLFLNGGFDNSLQHTKVSSTRITPADSFYQNGIERQGYSNPNVKLGSEYIINNNAKIGTIVSLQHQWEDYPSDASTTRTGSNPSHLNTSTIANATEDRVNANLNYTYSDTLGTSLSADLDLTQFHFKMNNAVANIFSNGELNNFNNQTKTNIDLYSVKVDYNKTIRKLQLEAGLKSSASFTTNTLSAAQTNMITSTQSTSDFKYQENNYAGYLSITAKTGKWSYQGGLRAEITEMKSHLIDAVDQQGAVIRDSSYLNLFPTLFLRYALSAKASVGISYSRRIDRPSFQDQNPYTYRTDFYYSTMGNPLLLPQFTQNVALDFILNEQLQLKASYSNISSLIETIVYQNQEQTTAVPANAGRKQIASLSLSTPYSVGKVLTGYLYLEPNYQFYLADLSNFKNSTLIRTNGVGFTGSLSSSYNFSKTFKMGVSSWISYSSSSAIYQSSPIYSVDLSLKKLIAKSKGSINITYRDLFNTQRVKQRAILSAIDQTNVRKWESSGIFIGLSYNLGNSKVKSNGANRSKTDEQERIKSRN